MDNKWRRRAPHPTIPTKWLFAPTGCALPSSSGREEKRGVFPFPAFRSRKPPYYAILIFFDHGHILHIAIRTAAGGIPRRGHAEEQAERQEQVPDHPV
jgi:hypothetical protein